jgi:ABC transporter
VKGPAKDVAMVFQSFALFPWLDVLDNVEIGLRATGVPPDETRQRALKGIDTIGLDGFESAYPKELSGGMRQRVGFARTLVMQPKCGGAGSPTLFAQRVWPQAERTQAFAPSPSASGLALRLRRRQARGSFQAGAATPLSLRSMPRCFSSTRRLSRPLRRAVEPLLRRARSACAPRAELQSMPFPCSSSPCRLSP